MAFPIPITSNLVSTMTVSPNIELALNGNNYYNYQPPKLTVRGSENLYKKAYSYDKRIFKSY